MAEMFEKRSDGGRFDAVALDEAVSKLFLALGLNADKARAVTNSLVRADMMGHFTHGLALVPWYVSMLRSGEMAKCGTFDVVSDRGACAAWNGNRLPGAWLLEEAIELAIVRAPRHGTFTITIAESQHMGALTTYLSRITEKGLLAVLTCSSPTAAGVAPYGGTVGLYSPNPLAAGFPTRQNPILLDICASITTNNRTLQLAHAGERFPGHWAIDAQGVPTDDPSVVIQQGGTLLPIGGLDHGHKGYAIALWVEAMTQGLTGSGRRAPSQGTSLNVFLQVIDPGAFGGFDAFVDETTWLSEACRLNAPRAGGPKVRVPGDQAALELRTAESRGVWVAATVMQALETCLQGLGIESPVGHAPNDTPVAARSQG